MAARPAWMTKRGREALRIGKEIPSFRSQQEAFDHVNSIRPSQPEMDAELAPRRQLAVFCEETKRLYKERNIRQFRVADFDTFWRW